MTRIRPPESLNRALRSFRGPCARLIREVAQHALSGEKPLACFDADGTLWAEDIGEAMLRWLAAGDRLPRLRGRPWREVWSDYERRVSQDRCRGYAWAVAVMEGIEETQLVAWCREFVAAWPNYRAAMVALLQGLHESGVEVRIVTATSEWLVRAAAVEMGLPEDQVLGIRVRVQNGVLTSEVEEPVTCRAGKVAAIEKALGRMPDLAVGDSVGDLEMLEAAQRRLVVARRDQPRAELVRIARTRGWPIQWF